MAASGRPLDDGTVQKIRNLAYQGATRREIAERLHVSLPTVSKYAATNSRETALPRETYENLRSLARAGFRTQDIARIARVSPSTVTRHVGHLTPCHRRRRRLDDMENENALLMARREGDIAAQRGLSEHACPYSQERIGLRCAWMAAFHDNCRRYYG